MFRSIRKWFKDLFEAIEEMEQNHAKEMERWRKENPESYWRCQHYVNNFRT